MRHGATTHIVEIGGDRIVALDFEGSARRVVLVDDLHDGIVGVEACEGLAIATFDCTAKGGDRNGFHLVSSLLPIVLLVCGDCCFAAAVFIRSAAGCRHRVGLLTEAGLDACICLPTGRLLVN